MGIQEVDLSEYAIALQRAISAHCRGERVPDDVRAICPHHAEKLDACIGVNSPVCSTEYRMGE